MHPVRRRTLALGSGAAAATFRVASSSGAQFSGRPVSIVVAYPAGGDTDALARLCAEGLAVRLGRPVVVDNRAGASGTLGAVHVARAAPDGDTLLLAPSTLATAPHVLRRGAGYDPVQDFAPVALVGTSPLLLVAGRHSGLRSLADLLAAGAAGRATGYGTPGSGSPMHILGEMFNRAAGLAMPEVAYRGVAPVINDLLAGSIPIGYVTPAAAAQHVRAGDLMPLAVSERGRSPVMPDVPTFAEQGFADVELGAWWGVFGPRGLPADVAAGLARHLDEALATPDVRGRVAALGVVPGDGGPARLASLVRDDHVRLGRLVRDLNIRAD